MKLIPSRGVSDALGAVRAISEITSILEGVIRGRSCVLLDWPAYPNVGDHLIWLGEKIILKKFLNVVIEYRSSYMNTDFDYIAKLKNSVILCNGGGNFGDLYIHHQQYREDIANRFHDRDVVFLPQTIHYENPLELNSSREHLSMLKNVIFFARDLNSYRIAKSVAGRQNVYLAIDCAFALQGLIPRLARSVPISNKRPLFLLRQDRESVRSNHDQFPSDAVVIDWIAEESLDRVLDEVSCDNIIRDNRLDDLIEEEWERRSLVHMIRAIALFANASYVVTDRLHAHILALIMGIKCYTRDNAYGKNSAFSRIWTCDDPLVVRENQII